MLSSLLILLIGWHPASALSCVAPIDHRTSEQRWSDAFQTTNLIGVFEVIERKEVVRIFQVAGGEQVALTLKPIRVFKGKKRKSHRWRTSLSSPLIVGERYLIALKDNNGETSTDLCERVLFRDEYEADALFKHLHLEGLIPDQTIYRDLVDRLENQKASSSFCSMLTRMSLMTESTPFRKVFQRLVLALSCVGPTVASAVTGPQIQPLPRAEELDPTNTQCERCRNVDRMSRSIPFNFWPKVDVVFVGVEYPASKLKKAVGDKDDYHRRRSGLDYSIPPVQGQELILRPYKVRNKRHGSNYTSSLKEDLVLLDKECAYLKSLPVPGKDIILVKGNDVQIVSLDQNKNAPGKIKLLRNDRHDRLKVEELSIEEVEPGKSVTVVDLGKRHTLKGRSMYTRPLIETKQLEARVIYFGQLPVLCMIDPRFTDAYRIYLGKAIKMTEQSSTQSIAEAGKKPETKVVVNSTRIELTPTETYTGKFGPNEKGWASVRGGGHLKNIGKEYFVVGNDVFKIHQPIYENFMNFRSWVIENKVPFVDMNRHSAE